MTATVARRWVVVCSDYTAGPFRSAETAERAMAEVIKLGACRAEHTVEQVVP